jgi:hypothetical protein
LDYAEKLRKVQVCVFYFAHESCPTLKLNSLNGSTCV